TDAGTTGTITFTSNATIDSQGGEQNDLSLDAGNATVFFNADIGAASGRSLLGTLTVVEANGGVTFGESDTNTGAGGTGPVTAVNTFGAINVGVGADAINGTGITFNVGSSPLVITTTTGSVRLNGAVTLDSDL